MMSSATLIASLTLFLVACGAEAPGGDEHAELGGSKGAAHADEPLGEHADEQVAEHADENVADMSVETLQARLAEAKAAVKAKKSEIKGLEQELSDQLEKSAGDVVGLLSGDTSKQGELDADLSALKDRVKTLEAELETLKAHVNTYADELAKR